MKLGNRSVDESPVISGEAVVLILTVSGRRLGWISNGVRATAEPEQIATPFEPSDLISGETAADEVASEDDVVHAVSPSASCTRGKPPSVICG